MIRFSKEKILLLHRIMAQATGGSPADYVTVEIGNSNQRVIESGFDMRNAGNDVFAYFFLLY